MPNYTSLVTCEWETFSWGPHEGCREFVAEPEVHPCLAAAVAWVQYPNEDGAGIGLLLCRSHLDEQILVETPHPDSRPEGIEVRLLADRGEGHIDGKPVFGHADWCRRWDMVHRCTCHCALDVYTGGHEDCDVFPGQEKLAVCPFGERLDLWFCQEHADWLVRNGRVLATGDE